MCDVGHVRKIRLYAYVRERLSPHKSQLAERSEMTDTRAKSVLGALTVVHGRQRNSIGSSYRYM